MINNSLIIKEKVYFWPNNDSLIQQDTTFRPTAQDTAEAKVYGVDPIFILNERRTKEIEEFKVRQKEIVAWRARQAKKPKIDTTCNICPKGDKIQFYQIVQSPKDKINNFSLLQNILFDKSYFLATNSISTGNTFLEEESFQSKKVNLVHEVIRPEQSKPQSNWYFFPLFGLFLILAILKVFYSRFVNYLLKSSIYLVAASKMHRENSILGQRIFLILDLVYFLSTSVYIVLVANYFQFSHTWAREPFTLAIFSLIALLLLRIFRYLFIFFSGTISQTLPQLKEFFFHQLIFPRILGLFLVPLLLIFAYSKGGGVEVSMYVTLAIVTILLTMRTLRSLRVFIEKGFSIFYFLLYLCALEIAPVLIFVKEIFGE